MPINDKPYGEPKRTKDMKWTLALEDALDELEGLPKTDWQHRRNESLRKLLEALKEMENEFYCKEALETREEERREREILKERIPGWEENND